MPLIGNDISVLRAYQQDKSLVAMAVQQHSH